MDTYSLHGNRLPQLALAAKQSNFQILGLLLHDELVEQGLRVESAAGCGLRSSMVLNTLALALLA